MYIHYPILVKYLRRYCIHSVLQVVACCDLDVWSFDLISMCQALIHTSPNFGEISSTTCEGIVLLTRFFRVTACCDRIPFLTQKCNQHIYEPNIFVIRIGWNCLHQYGRYGIVRLPWPWPLTFWRNQYFTGPGTYVT